jgi:RimJ/RimL family protein N-acetyltransferase
MDLESFATLRSFGTVVGLSDHTRDATVALASVALGAKIIEKHFTLDRALGGPDAFFSLEPAEFRAMVDAIRTTERALGRPRFGPGEEERASLAFRRSLFIARDVSEGDLLTCDNVRSVRPSSGLAPRHLPEILSQRATRAVAAGTPLAWDMVRASTAAPSVALREANCDDASTLLAWRNDGATREMSVSQAEVTTEEHASWLKRMLGSSDHTLLIAEQGGGAVGHVRFDRVTSSPDTWEISLTIDPAVRGRGLATELLRAAGNAAVSRGVRRFVARVRSNNERSLRAFKSAGYYAFVERSDSAGQFIFCERRLVPFGA